MQIIIDNWKKHDKIASVVPISENGDQLAEITVTTVIMALTAIPSRILIRITVGYDKEIDKGKSRDDKELSNPQIVRVTLKLII